MTFCHNRQHGAHVAQWLVATLCALATLAARPAHADKWALLIGIDTYEDSNHINSLGTAGADARAIKRALIEAEGVPAGNVRLLVSDTAIGNDGEARPERNTILRELASLAKNVKSGDTVFVFFSGHGIEKNGSSYRLPYDTDAFDDNTITDTPIDTSRFRDRLKAVHAGLLILAFDMCRNDTIKGTRDAAGIGNTLKPSEARGLGFSGMAANGGSAPVTAVDGPGAVVTLFSWSPDERSYECIGKGRGYFSWFLEQGLRGEKAATGSDGLVHVDTLTKYLAQSVHDAVTREEGKAQTPLVEIRGKVEASHLALTGTLTSPSPVSAEAAAPNLAADSHAYLKLALTPESATVFVDGFRQTPIAGKITIDMAGQPTEQWRSALRQPASNRRSNG